MDFGVDNTPLSAGKEDRKDIKKIKCHRRWPGGDILTSLFITAPRRWSTGAGFPSGEGRENRASPLAGSQACVDRRVPLCPWAVPHAVAANANPRELSYTLETMTHGIKRSYESGGVSSSEERSSDAERYPGAGPACLGAPPSVAINPPCSRGRRWEPEPRRSAWPSFPISTNVEMVM